MHLGLRLLLSSSLIGLAPALALFCQSLRLSRQPIALGLRCDALTLGLLTRCALLQRLFRRNACGLGCRLRSRLLVLSSAGELGGFLPRLLGGELIRLHTSSLGCGRSFPSKPIAFRLGTLSLLRSGGGLLRQPIALGLGLLAELLGLPRSLSTR